MNSSYPFSFESPENSLHDGIRLFTHDLSCAIGFEPCKRPSDPLMEGYRCTKPRDKFLDFAIIKNDTLRLVPQEGSSQGLFTVRDEFRRDMDHPRFDAGGIGNCL